MNRHDIFDVCIVGAGPGGAFLAFLLAQQGKRVLIIDKFRYPRDKVCGGGLSNKTLKLLPFSVDSVIQKKISGAFLTYENRGTVVKDLVQAEGAAVLRSEFDEFLVQRAVGVGATFQDETEFASATQELAAIRIQTSKGEIFARRLVGADGAASRVRSAIFGKDLVISAPALEALVRVSPQKAARIGDRVLFDFAGMPKGYGWIFPKEDHLNVGVFSIYPSKSIRSSLLEFMDRYDILTSPEHVSIKGFVIPLKNTKSHFEKGNVLLLGDAAGFAESFYGEGIYYALKSAALAAEAMDGNAEYKPLAYTGLVKKHLSAELFYSEMNARLFFSNQKFGFNNMVRSVHVNNYFSGLIDGGIGHKECFYKTIVTAPYWLFSKKIPPLGLPSL